MNFNNSSPSRAVELLVNECVTVLMGYYRFIRLVNLCFREKSALAIPFRFKTLSGISTAIDRSVAYYQACDLLVPSTD